MAITNAFIKDFFSYKRPHGSDTEQQWIERFILSRLGAYWWQDEVGNIHYDLRRGNATRTLFVAHTDTVHSDAGRQKVTVGKDNIVRVNDKKSNCLGADDGAGVLVLLAMIEMGVPGYYIFTRCEERGGVGASHLRERHKDLLSDFDRAIAFDRRGTSSVITHQGWGRCCSDEFANVLSDVLSDDNLMYAPDDTGVYTDTAEFVDIIPECTNISVGYMNEHTNKETLNIEHLNNLILRVINIEWDALPTERDPAVVEMTESMYGSIWDPSKYSMMGEVYSGYSDYNMMVYDACERALDGETDELIYMMCEAVNPADPDELYQYMWGMHLDDQDIRNCIRATDYAMDDEQTQRALISLYDAVIDGYHNYTH